MGGGRRGKPPGGRGRIGVAQPADRTTRSPIMLTYHAAVHLHHRASLGETLSPEERASLEAWYAKQDGEEMAALAAAPLPQDVAALRERVVATLTQLVAVTKRILALAAENERLHDEIAALRHQL